MATPAELVRVVATGAGGLAVGRVAPGRGAWLCAGSPACAEAAGRRRALTRALRAPVSDAAVAQVAAVLAGPGRERANIEDCGSHRSED